MTDIDYNNLVSDEWEPVTDDKVFSLMMELRDWRTSRKAGGYDYRLIDGAIAVCKAFFKRDKAPGPAVEDEQMRRRP